MSTIRPHKRAGYWYLIRRVPTAVSHLDKRGIVRASTHIPIADDPRGVRAARVVAKLNADLEAYWRALVAGEGAEARQRYDDARRLARALGFDYATASDLAGRDLGEILRRIEALVRRDIVDSQPEVAAVLGGVEKPTFRLSELFEEYEALNKATLAKMSPDQVRRWRNPKLRAIKNLMQVIGNKPIDQITRNDALDFREWWQERVVSEGLEIETANKDIGHLSKMLRTVDRAHRLGLSPVFGSLRLEGGEDGQRVAYLPEFVQNEILKDGRFDEINPEARRVMFLMIETGLRPIEAVNLTRETIFLDVPIPYVSVKPVGRVLKTKHSERDIPLVGVSLMAMREQPDGFPRYRDKSSNLSADINKALATRGLRPIEGQSLYSFRHTFEDRLIAQNAPDKVVASLMGHKWQRPKYGLGPSLAQKREWLLKIAFRPPSRV